MLLGDNAGGGAAMLLPISVQCAGVWISIGLLLMLVCIWPNEWATHFRLVLTFHVVNNALIRAASVFTRRHDLLTLRLQKLCEI
jgi:hypothetical protein